MHADEWKVVVVFYFCSEKRKRTSRVSKRHRVIMMMTMTTVHVLSFGFTSCCTGVLVGDCQGIGMNAARYFGAAVCNEEAAVVAGCIKYRPMCVCSYVG